MGMGAETIAPVNATHDAARAVHIDTSLQIEQQKVVGRSLPVQQALSKYVFSSTSSYARKEFKKAWLQDLALVYKLTRNAAQIGDVYTAIDKSTWARRRRLSRCLEAVDAFLSKHPTMALDVAVKRLRAHLGEAIMCAFLKWERSVTHEYKGTGCIRALERPSRATDGTIDVTVRECRRTKVQCSVHKFFREHEDAFDKIETEIVKCGADISQELKKTAETIREARRNAEYLCDSKNCGAMSDALIAVDGIATDHFAANNDKEWRTLAVALGKPLINPVKPFAVPESGSEARS
jgi:hypothetical protein